MDFPLFCYISVEGLRGECALSYLQGTMHVKKRINNLIKLSEALLSASFGVKLPFVHISRKNILITRKEFVAK